MELKPLHILLIDDDSDDVRLTRQALDRSDEPTYLVDEVASLREAATSLRSTPYDAVLLELRLPGSDGIEAVAQFRAICPYPPALVVLTEHEGQRIALEALDQGAQEYIIKSDIACLSHAIRHAITRQQMMVDLNTANALLQTKNARLSELYDTAQQFVDNVSHEFRTPLTVIREFTSIVRDGCHGPVTPKQFEFLGKVMQRTDDLAIMVDDMLDISRLESGRLGVWRRPNQVAEMISNVIGSLQKRAAARNIALTNRIAGELPHVYCDDEKAERVLVNLVVNAIKFTPDGGHIELWAQPAEDGTEIEVGVTDSGPGISPEDLHVVFERFKQLGTNLRSSTKGFGLGLNIAQELVRLNLGKMNVDSELGKGSTFSFTLPCNDRAVVFDRYADRIIELANTLSELSFLIASIPASSPSSARLVVDEYLQRSVRNHDLVIQADAYRWHVALSCPERDVLAAIDRLTKGWQEFKQNCPGGKLPDLELTHCGTWPLSAGLKRLRKEFQELKIGGATAPPAGSTVLVVDDDLEVSACLGVRLKAAGYNVLSAFDGEQGMAAIKQYHPNAIVLDLRMPKKDGMSLLQEVRADTTIGQTPVIVLSANIREQHRALEAGANFFISKPYEASAVLSAIEYTLTSPDETSTEELSASATNFD